ncbi:fatty acid amide hydrolase-like protein [Tanacetum coccineum]
MESMEWSEAVGGVLRDGGAAAEIVIEERGGVRWALSKDEGPPEMIYISNAIRDGAEGFFNTQYGPISKMALLLALLIFSSPCLPDLSPQENFSVLGSIQLGKYTEWFNDVFSPEISTMCEDILNMLSKTHGCKVVEVVIPELRQLRASHLLPVGSESLASLTPRYHDRNGIESGTDITRIT